MPGLIFDRKAGQLTRTVLIKGGEAHATQSTVSDFLLLPCVISELLLRHDGLCFSIYGENTLIPVLLKVYGANGTLELLDQGAIKFHLQSTMITYMVSDVPGVSPLASGRLSTDVHKDPEASVDSFLNRLTQPPPARVVRRLRRAFADAYMQPPIDHAPTAVKLGHEGYTKGRFSKLGLPPDRALGKLDKEQRAFLCRLASELHDLATLADLKMDTLDEFVITRVCDDSLRNLVQAKKIQSAAVTVFNIENVPQLSALFANGSLSVANVPLLRMNKDVVRFRDWLKDATHDTDASDISRRYLDAVTHRGFFQRSKGKLAKTLGVYGLSTALGGAVAGLGGAAAGAVASPAIDIGIDLLDEFVLDKLLKGWQPRNYFDKVIRPAIRQAAENSKKKPHAGSTARQRLPKT